MVDTETHRTCIRPYFSVYGVCRSGRTLQTHKCQFKNAEYVTLRGRSGLETAPYQHGKTKTMTNSVWYESDAVGKPILPGLVFAKFTVMLERKRNPTKQL